MSTPEAAMPAAASSQSPSRVRTRSCPPARMASSAIELTRKATPVITIAPSTALMREAPSLRQIVQVAAHRPESTAKRMALFTRRRYPERPPASCAARGEPGEVPFVQRGEHLVDRRRRPQPEERRLLHRAPVEQEARPRLLPRLARPRRLHRGGQARRLVGPAVPFPEELVHEIRIRRLGRVGPGLTPDPPAVTGEDAQLERRRLREPPEDADVAAAVRRPLLRDHEDLGRPVRLRGEPPDRRDLVVAEPQVLLPRAQRPAPVH